MAERYHIRVDKCCQFFPNAHRHHFWNEKLNKNSCFYSSQILNTEIGELWNEALQMEEERERSFIKEAFPFREGVFYMAGIHPWQASSYSETDLLESLPEFLARLYRWRFIQGIGEIGLDFSAKYRDFDSQQEALFLLQMKVAMEFNLPVTLHTVSCWQSIETLLSQLRPSIPLLFHRFNGSLPHLKQLAKKYQAYFSFSPEIFFSGEKALASLAAAPRERLLLEDEKADGSEARMKGYPLFFEQVAQLRGEDPLFLKEQVEKNILALFNMR